MHLDHAFRDLVTLGVMPPLAAAPLTLSLSGPVMCIRSPT